jgi:hypothetical protein
MPDNLRLSTVLSGVAGEYFVAAELSRRGFIASITLRNTRGVDILATNAEATRAVSIQVKTNQGSEKDWILSRAVETNFADNLFFVFVNLNGITGVASFHIVSSTTVATFCRVNHAAWLAAPGRAGRTRRDSSVRKFADYNDQYLGRWDLLGL